MKITIDVPDTIAPRVVNALCIQNNYQAKLMDREGNVTDNPESKGEFAKRMVIDYIKQAVKKQEAEEAARVARTSAESNVESTITLS